MNNYKTYLTVVALAVVVGLLLVYIPRNEPANNGTNNSGTDNKDDEEVTVVDDFLSCSVAGYAVMESFPRQCTTPDGEVFVEDIEEEGDVVISTPIRGQVVTSPLTVSGKARGNWFFEANLPVTLKDLDGNVLAQVGAMATGDWMTTDYVNFTTVLEFEVPDSEFGVLVIEKDNASGLDEFDLSFTVPVRFR